MGKATKFCCPKYCSEQAATISHTADIISVLLHSAQINPGLHVAFRYYHISMQTLNMDGLIPSNSLMHMSRYNCSFINAVGKQV
jgi:hypothetical protein